MGPILDGVLPGTSFEDSAQESLAATLVCDTLKEYPAEPSRFQNSVDGNQACSHDHPEFTSLQDYCQQDLNGIQRSDGEATFSLFGQQPLNDVNQPLGFGYNDYQRQLLLAYTPSNISSQAAQSHISPTLGYTDDPNPSDVNSLDGLLSQAPFYLPGIVYSGNIAAIQENSVNPVGQTPRRRRTPKACDRCHTQHRRCDGQLSCKRCTEQDVSCRYSRREQASLPSPNIDGSDADTPVSSLPNQLGLNICYPPTPPSVDNIAASLQFESQDDAVAGERHHVFFPSLNMQLALAEMQGDVPPNPSFTSANLPPIHLPFSDHDKRNLGRSQTKAKINLRRRLRDYPLDYLPLRKIVWRQNLQSRHQNSKLQVVEHNGGDSGNSSVKGHSEGHRHCVRSEKLDRRSFGFRVRRLLHQIECSAKTCVFLWYELLLSVPDGEYSVFDLYSHVIISSIVISMRSSGGNSESKKRSSAL
ncbi:hypothetical protein BC938DRAFT_480827 [Jimgerdemannia flammicorona]|uniref:Zn(2)-C6 fungal-type domain-containing protein n=1 Tax=Jimgerdemannia flammicorona TaxID=994334 RepID=A0A433QHL6_9FUNG|nr:hypothetical protein BC938DRAFT_480827 [Jimgerdemannia flammicorona]